MLYREQIDKSRVPAHVAIIMDGNGRWAKQRGQIRSFGHQAGAETVHIIAEEAARLGVKYLTLYTFSTENWNRPVDEVAALMSLLTGRGFGATKPMHRANFHKYRNVLDSGLELFFQMGADRSRETNSHKSARRQTGY